MIHNKKAIELSINFLVTLIIALVIFAFGVRFVYQISSKAVELKDLTSEELDSRVNDLLCTSSMKVCIGDDTSTIPRGELGVYGVKVLNVEDSQAFRVVVDQPTPLGYREDGNGILSSDSPSGQKIQFGPKRRDFTLSRNADQLIGIGVDVPKNTPTGTYILNVKVFKALPAGGTADDSCVIPPATLPADYTCYVSMQKLYVNVP